LVQDAANGKKKLIMTDAATWKNGRNMRKIGIRSHL